MKTKPIKGAYGMPESPASELVRIAKERGIYQVHPTVTSNLTEEGKKLFKLNNQT